MKVDNLINIDCDPEVEPDIVHDITKFPYPGIEDGTVRLIYLSHTIEHISETKHPHLLQGIFNLLEQGGYLVVSYPEFVKCAQNYINNYRGERDFWKATLYGRQLTDSDYHVALMDSRYFTQLLQAIGFRIVEQYAEFKQEFNTIIVAEKVKEANTRTSVLVKEIFGESNE